MAQGLTENGLLRGKELRAILADASFYTACTHSGKRPYVTAVYDSSISNPLRSADRYSPYSGLGPIESGRRRPWRPERAIGKGLAWLREIILTTPLNADLTVPRQELLVGRHPRRDTKLLAQMIEPLT